MSEPTTNPTLSMLNKALPAVVAAAILGGVKFVLDTKDELTQTRAEIVTINEQVREVLVEINRLHPRQ